MESGIAPWHGVFAVAVWWGGRDHCLHLSVSASHTLIPSWWIHVWGVHLHDDTAEDSCPQDEDEDLKHNEEGFEDNYHHHDDEYHHQGLGLLRVPCSIAIDSGETYSHHSSHHHSKKTPVAAYVDTGAQVTVISAAAAKRAGIYHLMDRRYAGRATGVGHCRVLGRIPARHVYFLLGGGDKEEEEDGGRGNDDDFSYNTIGDNDYPMRDFRGGGIYQ